MHHLLTLFFVCSLTVVLVLSQSTTCPGKLGISRTIRLDTTDGPRFGRQYLRTFLREKEILLTYDDGPNDRNTPRVLDALDDHCIKATFFMTGIVAVQYPKTVRLVARRGHTVASHTWSHKNHHGLSFTEAKAEVELGVSAVQKALGKRHKVAPLIRFPFLSDPGTLSAYTRKRDIGVLSIDIDSSDYRLTDPVILERSVLAQLQFQRSGAILLFHEGHNWTATAMQPILDGIHRMGFKIVHLETTASLETKKPFDKRVRRLLRKIKMMSGKFMRWPKEWSKVHYAV